ncbi:regulatory protein, luxR family [Geodermatophilus siccatus]|uniref:Regulatory protein, luxR family n=1 Tax=Geodermatophilus siccatus TaxID=1137991 RepID=A0A1G9YC36_9ACTN|nr:LuxR C-terminal-related transcriptional regulator [Geodermatophilus siccatus]SDN06638.1 regulatory protein, luxR family [Geodermatophilus siccatus]
MDDGATATAAIDRMLPERLRRLQQLTGVPVVFGGTTRRTPHGDRLVIGRLSGTHGDALRGLVVAPGLGLGGSVLQQGVARRVDDYATTTTITHTYDRIVVEQERITSVLAVPVVLGGSVRAVLYGAVRDSRPIGDRTLRTAAVVAEQLGRDVTAPPPELPSASSVALEELAAVIRETTDPALRARLLRIQRGLVGSAPGGTALLAPRELDALRLVAVGASNLEIAARLGLTPETVKAYLRSAMRRLGVHNRTAAVHAARVAGVL